MTTQSRAKSLDAIGLLTDDHKKVQKMFKDYEKLSKQEDEEGKEDLARQICAELAVHAQIEEEIFYPAAREVLDEQDILDEAEVEHATAKDLVDQIESMQANEDMFDAKVTVLGEYINHHVKEEQEQMFPKIKKSSLDLEALGEELAQRKQELMAEMGLDEETSGSGAAARSRSKDSSKAGSRRSESVHRH